MIKLVHQNVSDLVGQLFWQICIPVRKGLLKKNTNLFSKTYQWFFHSFLSLFFHQHTPLVLQMWYFALDPQRKKKQGIVNEMPKKTLKSTHITRKINGKNNDLNGITTKNPRILKEIIKNIQFGGQGQLCIKKYSSKLAYIVEKKQKLKAPPLIRPNSSS